MLSLSEYVTAPRMKRHDNNILTMRAVPLIAYLIQLMARLYVYSSHIKLLYNFQKKAA